MCVCVCVCVGGCGGIVYMCMYVWDVCVSRFVCECMCELEKSYFISHFCLTSNFKNVYT